MDILEGMNAHLGTRFSLNISWEVSFIEDLPNKVSIFVNVIIFPSVICDICIKIHCNHRI